MCTQWKRIPSLTQRGKKGALLHNWLTNWPSMFYSLRKSSENIICFWLIRVWLEEPIFTLNNSYVLAWEGKIKHELVRNFYWLSFILRSKMDHFHPKWYHIVFYSCALRFQLRETFSFNVIIGHPQYLTVSLW